MEIFWYGQFCFEIRAAGANNGENTTIVIDPFLADSGLKVPSVKADVLLITCQHPDHNNIKAVQGTPFLIAGPGEYEAKGVFAQGFVVPRGSVGKEELAELTMYILEIEGIRLCHLGGINQKELSPEQVEDLGEIDILLVPVGGKYTIDGETARRIVNQIEPKIVIPMHYKLPELKADLESKDVFLKAMGQEDIVPQPSLKIKKQGLPMETKIVVLNP